MKRSMACRSHELPTNAPLVLCHLLSTSPSCSSSPTRHWESVGALFSQLAENYSEYKTCENDEAGEMPSGTKGFGGPCDQFGKACRMVSQW